ncbi:MAG: glycosyltransferase family 87 protein [Desulfobaccales bacterium]|jgi:hypothetical protein
MSWLNQERLTVYPAIFLGVYLILYGFLTLGGSGLLDREGFPLGRDFSHYWVASSLALAGEPAAVYDSARLEAARAAVFGKPRIRLPFLYPPTYLLMILPLGLLPYLAALAVFLLFSLAGYLWLVHRVAPHRLTVWLTLAFPGTFQNFFFGQNGFLTGVLLGGGLLLLDRYPLAGGFLLGLVSYKPHLAILIPIALLAGRRWQALGAMVLAAVGLALASVLVLGSEVWAAFWKTVPSAMNLTQFPHWYNRPTVFSAVMLSGAGPIAAWIIQGGVMLGVTAALAWVWFRGAPAAIRFPILVLGILLFAPYAAVYDLAILAFPLAWLGWEGHTQGWLPGEQNLLVLGWLTPLVTPFLAKGTGLQLAPLVLLALLALALRRAARNPPLTNHGQG